MADNNRLYWMKLSKDFFKRHDVRIIESMPNGKDYVLFYLKLLLESITHNGELRFSETIPYDENMLSIVTNTNVDTVRQAMKVLIQLNLVEILQDETIFMTEVTKMIGSEVRSAERVRRFRENNKKPPKALQCNTDVTKCNGELDIELEKDIELDLNSGQKSTKSHRFVKPTLDEINEYILEKNLTVDADTFYDHYETNGWKVGKCGMKDWKAALRNWSRREQTNIIGKNKESVKDRHKKELEAFLNGE